MHVSHKSRLFQVARKLRNEIWTTLKPSKRLKNATDIYITPMFQRKISNLVDYSTAVTVLLFLFF